MPDIINSSFDPRLPFPLDVRDQVQDMNALYAIPNTSRWEGMVVYVKVAQIPYILKGGVDNSFWVPFQFDGGGGILPNGIVVYGEAQQSGNDILLNDAWVWRIDQVDYQSSDDTIAITPAASGNLRVDIIVGDALGDFIKVVGTEVASPGPAVEPNIPADTVPLLRVDVNDTGITAFEEFALSAFVRFDIANQGLIPTQRQNARTNIQALARDVADTHMGQLTNEGNIILNGVQATSAGTANFRIRSGRANVDSNHRILRIYNGDGVDETQLLEMTNRGTVIFNTTTGAWFFQASGSTVATINGDGTVFHAKSDGPTKSIRRDENYLTYPVTISGTGKLNDVALSNGVGMIQFGPDVTTVSGIDPNGDQKELIIWSDNVNGITVNAEDTDSIAANRFLREIIIPYRVPVKLIYKGAINRWVQIGGVGLEEQPYNPDQFEIDGITGEFQILDGLLGGDANRLVPGYNNVFEQTGDTNNESFRRILGVNGALYSISSTGTNNRFWVSIDGRRFINGGSTGSLQFYGLDVASHGTICIGARDGVGANTNILRSINGGATFTASTLPDQEVTAIKHLGAGRWVASCRTGTGNRALYSVDDGVNWTAATVANDNAYLDIGSGGGYVFMVASTGTGQVQISADLGVNYSASTPTTARTWGKCGYFLGNIFLMRIGVSVGGYLTKSSDGGSTWTEVLIPDDSNQELLGYTILGEWLYLYGQNGYIIRTNDLSTKEVVYAANALTTNEITAMGGTDINGYFTTMFGCETGTNDRIFSNKLL